MSVYVGWRGLWSRRGAASHNRSRRDRFDGWEDRSTVYLSQLCREMSTRKGFICQSSSHSSFVSKCKKPRRRSLSTSLKRYLLTSNRKRRSSKHHCSKIERTPHLSWLTKCGVRLPSQSLRIS